MLDIATDHKKPGKDQPADVDFPEPRPKDPASVAIHSGLALGLHWLRENHGPACAGEVEGVHHLRTTTRRLRSVLDVFHDLVEPAWADAVAEELKWLAGTLGAVRDLDVLSGRIAKVAGQAGISSEIQPFFDRLRERHDCASQTLREALQGDRYLAIEHTLAASLSALPVQDAASESCRKALPPLVGSVWKRLRQGGRALGLDDPDTDFHEVRKRAKRARYAAELVREALDPKERDAAGRFARRARRVQETLGEHQDAVIAMSELQAAADDHPSLGRFNFAAGRMLEIERKSADASRQAFFDVWDRLDRKKVVRWLSA